MMASLAPEYPFELQVKNTFLHSPMGHHWYTEGVSAMRRVASAPSLHQGCVDDVFDALEYGSAEVMLASADAGDRLCLAKPPPSVLLLANSSTPKSAGEGDAEASSADECTDIDGHNSSSAERASPRCGSLVLSPSSSTSASGSFRSNSPTPCDSFASEVVFPTVGVQEVEQKNSAPILRLAAVLLALDAPVSEPVVPEVPSLGSRGHLSGQCKPCMFVWRKVGCHNGAACSFCHLCNPGDLCKQRRKDKAEHRRWQSGSIATSTGPDEFQHFAGSGWF